MRLQLGRTLKCITSTPKMNTKKSIVVLDKISKIPIMTLFIFLSITCNLSRFPLQFNWILWVIIYTNLLGPAVWQRKENRGKSNDGQSVPRKLYWQSPKIVLTIPSCKFHQPIMRWFIKVHRFTANWCYLFHDLVTIVVFDARTKKLDSETGKSSSNLGFIEPGVLAAASCCSSRRRWRGCRRWWHRRCRKLDKDMYKSLATADCKRRRTFWPVHWG